MWVLTGQLQVSQVNIPSHLVYHVVNFYISWIFVYKQAPFYFCETQWEYSGLPLLSMMTFADFLVSSDIWKLAINNAWLQREKQLYITCL